MLTIIFITRSLKVQNRGKNPAQCAGLMGVSVKFQTKSGSLRLRQRKQRRLCQPSLANFSPHDMHLRSVGTFSLAARCSITSSSPSSELVSIHSCNSSLVVIDRYLVDSCPNHHFGGVPHFYALRRLASVLPAYCCTLKGVLLQTQPFTRIADLINKITPPVREKKIIIFS